MSQKKGIGIFLAIALLAVFVLFWFVSSENSADTAYVHLLEQKNQTNTEDNSEVLVQEDKNSETDFYLQKSEKKENLGQNSAVVNTELLKEQDIVCAYVCGKVKEVGMYKLPIGSRLFDFIEAAGGFSKQAAEEYLNLATKVEDGQRIYVPSKKEVKKWEKEKNSLWLDSDFQDETKSDSSWNDLKQEDSSSSLAEDSKIGRININTAGKKELMTLTGIGEAKADAIISYRENNGAFQTIEELMQISGIKEGIYQKICDNITV